MEGRMEGWKGGKAGLRIAYSNQKPLNQLLTMGVVKANVIRGSVLV